MLPVIMQKIPNKESKALVQTLIFLLVFTPDSLDKSGRKRPYVLRKPIEYNLPYENKVQTSNKTRI